MKRITIEITSKCPLNCVYCSTDAGPARIRSLPFTEISLILRGARACGFEMLSLSGGEPFEHPSFFDIVRYAKSLCLHVGLYSGGNKSKGSGVASISRDGFDTLAKLGVESVVFNLAGVSAGVHDAITGIPGSFDNLVASIRNAVSAGLKCGVHFVLNTANINEVSSLPKFSSSFGVEVLHVLSLIPHGRGKNREVLLLDMDATKRVAQELRDSWGKEYRCSGPGLCAVCTAGVEKCLITPEGVLYPCTALKHLPEEGVTIIGGDFSEAWRKMQCKDMGKRECERIRPRDCSAPTLSQS